VQWNKEKRTEKKKVNRQSVALMEYENQWDRWMTWAGWYDGHRCGVDDGMKRMLLRRRAALQLVL
jgi:hypothetical protein